MPIHDWTRVDAGIFHAFHHDWITEIARALNRGLLPTEYYALPEQLVVGFRAPAEATVVTVRKVAGHQVMARVEILSPFGRKGREVLPAGIHLLLVGLFPVSLRAPQGIPRRVAWEDNYALHEHKALTCVAYV